MGAGIDQISFRLAGLAFDQKGTMKIYYSNMASVKTDLFPQIGVLISFYGLRTLTRPSFCDSLFLDSGAFSAFRRDVKIDLDEYTKFIYENKNGIDIYCSLDDIKSPQISMDNFLQMKKSGLNPLPCFHYGEPRGVLDFYLEHTDYVALGGVAGPSLHRQRIKWIGKCFNNYPTVKFHGFGITSDELLDLFSWHSVDASSVHMQARFGGIMTPWGWIKINPKVKDRTSVNLDWREPESYRVVEKWVTDKGIDYNACKDATTEGIMLRCLVGILYFEEKSKTAGIIDQKGKQKGFGFW